MKEEEIKGIMTKFTWKDMYNSRETPDFLKKELCDLKVGDQVWCDGNSGFCRGGVETITKISTRYNPRTGKPYPVIHCGNHRFHGIKGHALNAPLAYYITPL